MSPARQMKNGNLPSQQISVQEMSRMSYSFYRCNSGSAGSDRKFVTVEEIQKEYPDYAKDTKNSALNQAANSDGVKRAVPTTGYWEGMYCNRDLFEKYSIPVPTDWDSMLYAIEEFQSMTLSRSLFTDNVRITGWNTCCYILPVWTVTKHSMRRHRRTG